jgi:hypothetical protein
MTEMRNVMLEMANARIEKRVGYVEKMFGNGNCFKCVRLY